MAETTKRLRIYGHVQGVFYRAWSAQAARALGLSGWVRNRRDGSVEMLVAGEDERVRRLIDDCRTGPPAAAVERIDVEESADAAPEGFETRPTV